jgi:hypothetical protein
MHVWLWNNPNPRIIYASFLQSTTNHNQPFASRERITNIVAILCAADYDYEFLSFPQNLFNSVEMPQMERLKSPNV